MARADTAEDQAQLREAVRPRYAAAATRVSQEHTWAESALPALDSHDCCSSDASCSCGTPDTKSVITSGLYAVDEVADLPSAAVLASFGCGNPTALSELKPGETVQDLGSGGGIDVIISNCVIDLSCDKPRVLREASRVLKPGAHWNRSNWRLPSGWTGG
ncbi:MAG: hypothetical protein JO057_10930, partial [Chloroflexi bacterium]|nr:hypothetical protein [Chloroflexota bacterium]